MQVKTRRHVEHILEYEDKEYELSFEPNEYNKPVVKATEDGHLIVGYLVHDDDCQHPLDDCDGMGEILDRRRHSHDSESEINEALGLNSYGEQESKGNPYAVLLNVYSHGMEAWEVMGDGTASWPDRQWDVSNGAGVWIPDESCIEHIKSTALQCFLPEGFKIEYKSSYLPDGKVRMLTDGKTPDPRHFNVITWTLPDGRSKGGYKSFRAACLACAKLLGIKIDPKLKPQKIREAAIECARGVVEEYNKWLSGDCWGVCVDVFDPAGERVEEDACWGFIGSEYAEGERNQRIEYYLGKLTRKE